MVSEYLAFLFVDNFDKIAAGAPGVCYVPFRALLFRRRYVRAVRAPISGGMVPVTEKRSRVRYTVSHTGSKIISVSLNGLFLKQRNGCEILALEVVPFQTEASQTREQPSLRRNGT